MIKISFICFFLFSFFTFASLISAHGQRFGYVDSDFILNQMPEYNEAQAEINKISMQWLKAEEVLLTRDMREERLNHIKKKENEVKAYHNKVFGYEGLLFLKRKELIKPLQEKVFKATEKVAKRNRLQMIFDKSGDLIMIYTDPIYDFTENVLEELGIGQKQEETNWIKLIL